MNVYRFKIYGNDFETRVVRREDEEIVISVNGQEYKAYLPPRKSRVAARPTPRLERAPMVPTEGPRKTASPAEAEAKVVKAPLPGLILRVHVKVGDVVKLGDPLCVTEAMKMENTISAPIAGTISAVSVKEGDAVMEGQPLFTVEQG
jgi:glutaconyl-CoA/methylmalonyl-CoA decarboxylase subunit gamma